MFIHRVHAHRRTDILSTRFQLADWPPNLGGLHDEYSFPTGFKKLGSQFKLNKKNHRRVIIPTTNKNNKSLNFNLVQPVLATRTMADTLWFHTNQPTKTPKEALEMVVFCEHHTNGERPAPITRRVHYLSCSKFGHLARPCKLLPGPKPPIRPNEWRHLDRGLSQ